jgi:CTP synthase (UTP-ammonia lyase)
LTKIAILGEYNADFPPHPATNAAILHSRKQLGQDVKADWVSTASIDIAMIDEYSAIWVAPGSPYKNMEKTLEAIRHARENAVPCLGTCGGFQHMVIEYARNVLGYKDAQHAEYDPYASNLFISSLACSLAGKEMNLKFAGGSRVAEIYGALEAKEQYYCNFGVNPDVVPLLEDGTLQIVGSDSEGAVRVLELSAHPFFIATLFVPQTRSRPDQPHPLVTSFLKAAAQFREFRLLRATTAK